MARHVLVAVDRSDHSDRAVEHALEEFPDAKITAIHALDYSDLYMYGDIDGGGMIAFDEMAADQKEAAERLLEETAELAAEHGQNIETVLKEGRPARAVVEFAEESDVDHVVVGSHGRSGASRILLGSVAETIVRRSPVPVTIVR